MSLLSPDKNGCPYLQLAPMEGVGDASFRKAIASIGGFDEAVRDFLRVPADAHIKSLVKGYDPRELAPIPLAAQIMGSDPHLMAQMAVELSRKGALRIDVNCGCPSNQVTGRGAGSSLLKDPNFLHEVVKAVVRAVCIPVTVKMRSGYEDTSLFRENLRAAEETGVRYITLHPRTKVEGYGPPANWELIAEAKRVLKIPVVGNGDITTVQNALEMIERTKCDSLMIGRGSIMNPFLFHQIKAHYAKTKYYPKWEDLICYLKTYIATAPPEMSMRLRVNKFKQLLSFLFRQPTLLDNRQLILKIAPSDPHSYLEEIKPLLEKGWKIH